MRIRSIKPEFWRSTDISMFDWYTRLVFIGLWAYVDDNGVGEDRLATIAADLFADDMERDPRETLARVSGALAKLSEAGRIVRYAVEKREYLEIANWDRHQRIDKPNRPRHPSSTCENAVIRETLASDSRDSRETLAPGTGEQGNRGTGEVTTTSTAVAANAEAEFDQFWDLYPRKDGKKTARQKFDQARKRASLETILDGVRRYRSALPADRSKIKMAEGWLNGDRWNDPTPIRGDAPPRPWTPPPGSPLSYVEM